MQTDIVFASALQERQAQHRLRSLRSFDTAYGARISDGVREYINFSSNDYLGLSRHPFLKARAAEYLDRYGTGLGSSRLLSGNLRVYDEIESKIAKLKGTEAALLLPSGFQTNSTVIAALAQSTDLFLLDSEDHNSIFHGVQVSRGRFRRFAHNQLQELQALLRSTAKHANRWIITESVFSMDGTTSDIDALTDIAREHNANLYIDEAHATGLFGHGGAGLASGSNGIKLIMGTFSKAMGSFGAYIACSEVMRQYLVNFCSGIIYSTALPPPVLGAIDAALDLIPQLDENRLQLQEMGLSLRESIVRLGFETLPGCTPIVPIITGDDESALALASYLEDNRILAPAIRPPTVPDGTARVRLSISTAHTKEDIELLLQCLKNWAPGAVT